MTSISSPLTYSVPSSPSNAPESLGIYVHIPFCRTRCHYCGFDSGVDFEALGTRYLEALHQEIDNLPNILKALDLPADAILKLTVESLYFGGGTPSWLDPSHIVGLMSHFRKKFDLMGSVEITVEVNPGDASLERFQVYLDAGVNRFSLGVQGFQDAKLKLLGRRHHAVDAEKAVENARRAGVQNLSLDLMAGLPGQSLEEWQETLKSAVDLQPEHISVYLLEIHENTLFGRLYSQPPPASSGWNPAPPLPDEDLLELIYTRGVDFLDRHGYPQYEISNFAKNGYASRHNLRYWLRQPVLGLGCSAFSNYGKVRWGNVKTAGRYLEEIAEGGIPTAEKQVLEGWELAGELFFLAMRMKAGISMEEFQNATGVNLAELINGPLHPLLEGGFAEISGGILRLTSKGFLLSNEVFAEVLRVLEIHDSGRQ